MIRPTIKVLSQETIERAIAEAHGLLRDPGVRVHSDEALRLLGDSILSVVHPKTNHRLTTLRLLARMATVSSLDYLVVQD